MRTTFFIFMLLISYQSISQSNDEKIKQRVEFSETPGFVIGVYENGKPIYVSH